MTELFSGEIANISYIPNQFCPIMAYSISKTLHCLLWILVSTGNHNRLLKLQISIPNQFCPIMAYSISKTLHCLLWILVSTGNHNRLLKLQISPSNIRSKEYAIFRTKGQLGRLVQYTLFKEPGGPANRHIQTCPDSAWQPWASR